MSRLENLRLRTELRRCKEQLRATPQRGRQSSLAKLKPTTKKVALAKVKPSTRPKKKKGPKFAILDAMGNQPTVYGGRRRTRRRRRRRTRRRRKSRKKSRRRKRRKSRRRRRR